MLRLAVLLKYFESQIYFAMDIEEEMKLVIYNNDQLRGNWYLTSLKRMFVMGFSYLFIFTLKEHVLKKADFFLFRKNMC